MSDEDEKTLKSLADDLVRTANNIRKRIADDGTILGWRGFHLDIENAADLLEALPFKARGVSRPMMSTHPWGAFLHARAIALRWLRDEQKETPEKIAQTMSMDPGQVRLILMHVDSSPDEYAMRHQSVVEGTKR